MVNEYPKFKESMIKTCESTLKIEMIDTQISSESNEMHLNGSILVETPLHRKIIFN